MSHFSISLADDLGAKPACGCAGGHQRHHRLSHRGVPSRHQLLGVRECHAPADQQVRHRQLRDQLPRPHEADRQQPAAQRLRHLPLHQQELSRRDGGLDPALRYVVLYGLLIISTASPP